MSLSPFLHPFAPPAREDFVKIVRGEGAAVFDDQGKRYVDALASLWYCNIGHGREEMTTAISSQLRILETFHTFDRYTNEPCERLCQRLSDLAPMGDARVFLTNSGSEAVDSAIKLARISHSLAGRRDRNVIVSRRHAYHGVTYGGLSVQGIPPNQEGFGPLVPGIVQVDHDDLTAVEELFSRSGDEIAAVIAEPVIGAGGVFPPPPEYLQGLRAICNSAGAFLILDEVICGFGRLGGWWGADHYGVQPDMVTFAKGVTSGYLPLGGVLVGSAVRKPLESDPQFVLRHGHTYSGHATACAAGLKAIEITKAEDLLSRASPIGKRLADGLGELLSDGLLAGVRGEGALWAAQLKEGVSAIDVREGMMTHGVIARPLGGTAIAFCPPLVIEEADLDLCVDALRAALQEQD